MAQRNTKQSASRSSQRNTTERKSSFPAFFYGLIVGALGMHFLPLLLENDSPLPSSIPQSTENIVTPDFQFPNILKGIEITVPESNPEPAQEANASYLLQVASFKNQRDAESLRVRLLLLNLNAFVEPFDTNSGDNWHRVLVGPFENESKTVSARTKLAENDLESLLLKRNNPD